MWQLPAAFKGVEGSSGARQLKEVENPRDDEHIKKQDLV